MAGQYQENRKWRQKQIGRGREVREEGEERKILNEEEREKEFMRA